MELRRINTQYQKIYRDSTKYLTPIITALNELPVYYRYYIKNGLALGKGKRPKIEHYQKHIQSQKRKETKRNEGRVHKKRRVEDVEKLEDVFASFNIEDDDVPHRQYIETHGVVHPDV